MYITAHYPSHSQSAQTMSTKHCNFKVHAEEEKSIIPLNSLFSKYMVEPPALMALLIQQPTDLYTDSSLNTQLMCLHCLMHL